MSSRCYIAGPMSGLPQYNFPAFDEARDYMVSQGWRVWSPADMDRGLGFDEHGPPPTPFKLRAMLQLDLQWIIWQCDAVVMLPEWWRSNGARCEYYLARSLALPVYAFHPGEAPSLVEIDPCSVVTGYSATNLQRNVPEERQCVLVHIREPH